MLHKTKRLFIASFNKVDLKSTKPLDNKKIVWYYKYVIKNQQKERLKNMTNSKLLADKLQDKQMTMLELAKKIRMPVKKLKRKINNEMDFTCGEVESICRVLSIKNGREFFFKLNGD